ncbi:hypothetical protein [Tenacibaculum sp. MAR_2009_124]|uniref:hypothetical protein n=1 Tax=Tenacibaculum sp. MAR_2009_124 TaxID=1250059 RepID=UPI0015A3EF18|nr:hypothetical protein [Tenacibaculum sp. MAR_2009_124]
MISLFILIHVVVFPIIYVLIIKNDPSSIEIDSKVLSFEKKSQLNNLELNYNKNDIDNQKLIIENILKNDKKLLEKETIYWFNDNDPFHEDEPDYSITTGSSTLYFYERDKEIPNEPYGRFIEVEPKDKSYKDFELKGDFEMSVIEILDKGLRRLELLSKERKNELKIIKSNKFWSYKEVLPYTINILFSDSFKPKKSFSQLVHFLHNVLVAVFLFGFIVSLLQNSLEDKKESNIEERLDRIEKTLKEIEDMLNGKRE